MEIPLDELQYLVRPFFRRWSVPDSNRSPRHCQYSTDMITIVCFTRYCGISENTQRFVLVKYRVISVVYTSYVFKYFVDEKRTIVRTFQYTLFFRFPVYLGEQFCFLLVGGRQLIYGSGKEPTPPAFAGRGELAIVCSFTSGRTLRYYGFHLSNFTAIPSMIYWSLFKFFPLRFMIALAPKVFAFSTNLSTIYSGDAMA